MSAPAIAEAFRIVERIRAQAAPEPVYFEYVLSEFDSCEECREGWDVRVTRAEMPNWSDL